MRRFEPPSPWPVRPPPSPRCPACGSTDDLAGRRACPSCGLALPGAPDQPPAGPGRARPRGRIAAAAGLALVGLLAAGVLARRGPPGLDVRWRLQAGSPVVGGPQVEGPDLYAATRSGSVVAVDAGTGEAQWRFETGERVLAEPVVAGGSVFVSTEVAGSSDGHLFAVDARTGAEQWRFATTVAKVGPPAVAGGGGLFVSAGDVIALDAGTGEIRWRQAVAGAGPVVAGAGVVVVTTPAGLAALDPVTGGPRWAVATPAPPQAPALVTSDAVLSDDGSGALLGLDPADGTERWRAPTAGLAGPPAAAGNVVVVATAEGVSAFDARSGKRRWQERLDPGALRVATDGTMVAAAAGRLSLLDGGTGEVLGRRPLEPDLAAQPAVAGTRIYLAAGETVEALAPP